MKNLKFGFLRFLIRIDNEVYENRVTQKGLDECHLIFGLIFWNFFVKYGDRNRESVFEKKKRFGELEGSELDRIGLVG